jgi:tetratricopeptide (TPR) repeat protein
MWARPSDEIAIEVMKEALNLLGEAEPGVRARAKASIAYGSILAAGDIGLRASEEAVALATATGDDDARKIALVARAWSVWGNASAGVRLAAGEALRAAGEQIGDRNFSQAGEWHIGNALLVAGDIEAAVDVIQRSTGFEGALSGFGEASIRTSLAYAQGRYAEAEVLGEEAHARGIDLADTNDALWGQQVQISNLERGNVAAARANYELVAHTAIIATGPYLAMITAAEGDRDQAQRLTAGWVRDVMPHLPGVLLFAAADRAAPLVEQMGLTECAPALWDYLAPFSGEIEGNASWIGYAIDHSLGLLAATMERLDDAIELLLTGHHFHAERGLHARSAQSAYDLGRMLWRRGEQGDREAGEGLVLAAAELAEQIGRVPLALDARMLLG